MDSTNKAAQPGDTGLGQDPANIQCVRENAGNTSAEPMHAARARDVGMDAALRSTSREDCAAIAAALLRGFDLVTPLRAEDALQRAAFDWPAYVSPRCLGAIVSHLARADLIVEQGWTKGRTGRSHAGRVSLWLKAAP